VYTHESSTFFGSFLLELTVTKLMIQLRTRDLSVIYPNVDRGSIPRTAVHLQSSSHGTKSQACQLDTCTYFGVSALLPPNQIWNYTSKSQTSHKNTEACDNDKRLCERVCVHIGVRVYVCMRVRVCVCVCVCLCFCIWTLTILSRVL